MPADGLDHRIGSTDSLELAAQPDDLDFQRPLGGDVQRLAEQGKQLRRGKPVVGLGCQRTQENTVGVAEVRPPQGAL